MCNWVAFFVASQVWVATSYILEDGFHQTFSLIIGGAFMVLSVISLIMSDRE